MINISSAMAGQLAFAAAEFTAEILRLGPNPLRGDRPLPHQEAPDSHAEEGNLVTNASHS